MSLNYACICMANSIFKSKCRIGLSRCFLIRRMSKIHNFYSKTWNWIHACDPNVWNVLVPSFNFVGICKMILDIGIFKHVEICNVLCCLVLITCNQNEYQDIHQMKLMKCMIYFATTRWSRSLKLNILIRF